ncbi:MAG: lytic transglycosylase domain-containing protein [Clostridiales bacterium]|nr:lytic transglycosylase domain-containing protein [Clostridiales bacterium]
MKKVIGAVAVLALAALLALGYTLWIRPAILRRQYPLAYLTEVLALSEEYGLSPSFVSAVILCESRNNPDAVSRRGATGLMQLMPPTAAEIAENLGLHDYLESALLEPQTNIRFGCYYLNYLFDRFGDRPALVLAAYNAGPTRVQGWIEEYGLDEAGALQEIPYPETAKYVVKVQNAEKMYRMLYEKEYTND